MTEENKEEKIEEKIEENKEEKIEEKIEENKEENKEEKKEENKEEATEENKEEKTEEKTDEKEKKNENEEEQKVIKEETKEKDIDKDKENIENENKKDEQKSENKEENKVDKENTNEYKDINDIENKDSKENKEVNDIDKKKEEKDEDEITDILSKIHLEEMRNYIGIVTNETIFEYLVFNYYSEDMKEFNLSLNELLVLGNIPLLKKLDNGKDAKEKVYNTFNNYLFNNSDIIPILNGKEIEGFIYPKDFLYYIYNLESKQSLTNEEFLINLYKDIDEEKPYGKNRVIYLELNEKNKAFYVKELIEKLNSSIEKKIIVYDPNDNSNIYLISLKTIFRSIVEFQSNKK